MNNKQVKTLEIFAKEIRRNIILMSHKSKVGHLASGLSIVDILVVLYCSILHVNAKLPKMEDRDRFILSKGHAASALYAILAKLKFFPLDWLDLYCKDGGKLGTHPDHFNVSAVEWTTGSLGHGLSVACGMAIGLKYKRSKRKVYVLISDAESQEGEIWEAALTAAQHKLNNLVAILDYNKVQAFGKVKDVLSIDPVSDKWKSFGWQVHEINGHDISALLKIFKKSAQNKPQIIIAHTIRGKGIPFMEHKMEWYYNYPKAEDVEKALKFLE